MDTKRKTYAHRARHNESENDVSLVTAIRACTCGLLVSFAAAVLMLSILAVYALTRPDPEGFLLPIASFLCYPSAIFGGFMSCKLYRGSPVLCGVIFALMNIVVSMVLYPLLPSTDAGSLSTFWFFALRGLLVLCCAVGSFLGAKSLAVSGKRRRRRR